MTKSSLSKEWRLVKLGELAVRVMEKYEASPSLPERWVGADHLDEGDLRIRRWSMSDDPVFPPTFKFKFPIGAVLIHSRNPKKVAVSEFSAITGEKIFALSSRDDSVLSSQFLALVLQSVRFEDFTNEWMTGSVNKFLNWSALERFEFVLPPIVEQHRIVEALLTVDEAVHLSRASNTDELKVSLVHSLFDNEVYTRRHLADFSEISIGGIWGSAVGEDEVNVEIVRQTEFCDNATIALGSGEIRSISKSQLSNRQLIKGDILIQKSAGTPTLCGRVVRITSNTEEPVVCSNFLHMFRVRGSADLADFVFWSLWYLHRVGKVFDLQRGTSIRNLDMGRYVKQTLPALPTSDLKDFVTQIRSIDNLESELEIMQSNLKISAHVLREHLLAGKNV